MENYSLSNPLLTFTQNDYTLVWTNYIMYLLLYCCCSSNINFYLKKYATLIISEFRMGEHPPHTHHLPVSAYMHTYSTTCHFPTKSYTSSHWKQTFNQQGLHPSVHVCNTSNTHAVEAELHVVTTNKVIL